MTTKKQEALVLVDQSNSFQKRLEDFISSLTVSEAVKQTVRNEVVKFILTIQTGMGAQTLRAISRKYGFDTDFNFFKNMYLDKSAYLHKTMWREVVYFIQNGDFKNKEDVLMSDVLYSIKHLSDSDIEKVILMKINHDLNVSLDLADPDFRTGMNKQRDIQAYAKSKTNTLAYLSKYDPAMTPQDFQQDIIEEMLRVNNVYNKSSGANLNKDDKIENAIMKYSETALNNKVNQIKDYWSSGIRSRISSTQSKLYSKRDNLYKELNSCKDENEQKKILAKIKIIDLEIKDGSSDYYSVVVPLVRTNESENREVDAQEINPEIIEESNIEETIWISELLQDLPPKLSRCVNILIGNYDEEFVLWLNTKCTKKYNIMILDHLLKAATEFCKVTKNELRNNTAIVRALADAPATKRFFEQKESEILVQNTVTKKVYAAKVNDYRDDGTHIFSIKNDTKVIDTGFDKKWRLIQ